MNTNETNPSLLHNSVAITESIQALRNKILDGEVDALAAFINLGRAEKIIAEVKKDPAVVDCALNAFSRYGQKTVAIGDCEVTEAQTAIKYDFSECGDAELNELYQKKSSNDAAIKEREGFLKQVKKPTLIAEPETGELYTIYPPVKSSKTTLKLTYKKK